MDSEDSFFELSKSEVDELSIEVRDAPGGCSVYSHDAELFEIVNCTFADERRDSTLYSTFFCQTAHVGERETQILADPITGVTLGYVFPVTAFRDGDNFENIWTRRFADVGFRSATSFSALSRFGATVAIESLRDRKLYLDQVFNDALSIAVLGNAAIGGLKVDYDTLELMLLKKGIGIVRSRQELLPRAITSVWANRVRLAKPGPLVACEAAVFLSLIKSADRDHMGIGAFMHLYQALEFCIDHIFGWGIQRIANANLDTWEMKDRLSKITGEAHRLSLLDGECLSLLPSRQPLNNLADSCREFLKCIGVEIEEGASWYKLLYKCRNIIVHNQLMMMKASNAPIFPLIADLRSASLDVLFFFSIPDAQ